jgi:glycosyltransferase involved in cell wall biosynthesis
VVACGSDEVASVIEAQGVAPDRILITPNGVDVELFAPREGSTRRRELGLDNRFVVAWTGSFRPFHGVDSVIRGAAASNLADLTLLLVGDGPERRRLEQLAADVGVHAVFTGTVPHRQVADHLAVADAAVVAHGGRGPFHYSPLKLREYLSCGLPVVAPRVGELARELDDGVDALLVRPGDVRALGDAFAVLHADRGLCERLGAAGRNRAVQQWSWSAQVRRVRDAVDHCRG